MRIYITAAALVLAATVGFAQEAFDVTKCPNTPVGQLQEQAHTMLT